MQLPQQPDLREGPVPFDGFARAAQNAGDLRFGQSGKETQFHDLTETGIQLFQIAQGVIQGKQVGRLASGQCQNFFRGDFELAFRAAGGLATTGVIHQNPAHLLGGGEGKKYGRFW